MEQTSGQSARFIKSIRTFMCFIISRMADETSTVIDRDPALDKSGGIRCPALRLGHLAKRTNGSAPAALSGTHSIREECVQPAFTSGLRPSASHAADGRCIRTGMRIDYAIAVAVWLPCICSKAPACYGHRGRCDCLPEVAGVALRRWALGWFPIGTTQDFGA
jgi:hypothetical protein